MNIVLAGVWIGCGIATLSTRPEVTVLGILAIAGLFTVLGIFGGAFDK